jgi:hypothetical protein
MNKKCYLITSGHSDDFTIHGIFSDPELAKQYIDEHLREGIYLPKDPYVGIPTDSYCKISESVIDPQSKIIPGYKVFEFSLIIIMVYKILQKQMNCGHYAMVV